MPSRRLGEMLKAGQDAGQVAKAGDRRKYSDKEYLDDLGLDAKTSHIAQKLAELPQEQFEQVREGASTITKAIREVVHSRQRENWYTQAQARQEIVRLWPIASEVFRAERAGRRERGFWGPS